MTTFSDVDVDDNTVGGGAESTASVDDEKPTGAVEGGDSSERDDRPRRWWLRFLTQAVLPSFVIMLTLGAGYLKWLDGSASEAERARTETVQAAIDITVAMLSYDPDSVERDLGAVRDRLIGSFKDSYISLINDVVIPGAKQRHISAVATVPAAASASTSGNSAVVLVFVNQTVIVGNDPPTNSASTVRVTMEEVNGKWLVSQFEPI